MPGGSRTASWHRMASGRGVTSSTCTAPRCGVPEKWHQTSNATCAAAMAWCGGWHHFAAAWTQGASLSFPKQTPCPAPRGRRQHTHTNRSPAGWQPRWAAAPTAPLPCSRAGPGEPAPPCRGARLQGRAGGGVVERGGRRQQRLGGGTQPPSQPCTKPTHQPHTPGYSRSRTPASRCSCSRREYRCSVSVHATLAPSTRSVAADTSVTESQRSSASAPCAWLGASSSERRARVVSRGRSWWRCSPGAPRMSSASSTSRAAAATCRRQRRRRRSWLE